MTGHLGTRIRAYTITDLGRRYLRMVDAGVEPVETSLQLESLACRHGHVGEWHIRRNGSRPRARECERVRNGHRSGIPA